MADDEGLMCLKIVTIHVKNWWFVIRISYNLTDLMIRDPHDARRYQEHVSRDEDISASETEITRAWEKVMIAWREY